MKSGNRTRQLREEPGEVEEFQGLYGSFEFPERLLQKIWHLGYYTPSGLSTSDGRSIEILSAGEWNRAGGGPDFVGASLRIDGRRVHGDIEMHFHPGDWNAHGHQRDPAFDRVVLHVSLFEPGKPAPRVANTRGTPIPLLVLLPHLTCSIEEFALDDALEQVTGTGARRGLAEFLQGGSPELVLDRLSGLALKRWEQKVGFARVRIDKLGWERACHHTALEILGYRHNRAPMLAVAEAWPLAEWTGGGPTPEALLESGGKRWRVGGVRPANHPKLRLAQYAAWARKAPDWPDRLRRLGAGLPTVPAGNPLAGASAVRKSVGLAGLRDQFAVEIVGEAVSGTRLDTIITSGLLPLLAAHGTRELFGLWCCWFAGDSPDWLKAALRETPLGRGGRAPLCEGLVQAALQLTLEQPAVSA